MRESPAIDVVGMLARKGAVVSYHDPYVSECEIDGVRYKNRDLTDDVLTGTDIAVIITDHTDVDYARVAEKAPRIFDTRNATRDLKVNLEKITKL
jgi:UDP-N-acetyl-D-glucosamine dehydrogenase